MRMKDEEGKRKGGRRGWGWESEHWTCASPRTKCLVEFILMK